MHLAHYYFEHDQGDDKKKESWKDVAEQPIETSFVDVHDDLLWGVMGVPGILQGQTCKRVRNVLVTFWRDPFRSIWNFVMFWRRYSSRRRLNNVDDIPRVFSEDVVQRYDEGEDVEAWRFLVGRLVEDLVRTNELYEAPRQTLTEAEVTRGLAHGDVVPEGTEPGALLGWYPCHALDRHALTIICNKFESVF